MNPGHSSNVGASDDMDLLKKAEEMMRSLENEVKVNPDLAVEKIR